MIWSDLFIKHSSDYVCQQQIYYLYAPFVLLKELAGGFYKSTRTKYLIVLVYFVLLLIRMKQVLTQNYIRNAIIYLYQSYVFFQSFFCPLINYSISSYGVDVDTSLVFAW